MRTLLLIVATAVAGCTSLPSNPPTASTTPSWIYVWTGSADTTRRSAFLVQFDIREGSPTAGKIVRVINAGPGTRGTHHAEHSLPSDGLLFADDFGLGRTFVFDLRNPLDPKVHSSFTTAGPFGWPHSYARMPSGNRLVTYQFQASKFNLPPGGIAEVRTDGTIVRWAGASTAGVDDKEITPYSLELLPALDRVVTTSTSMVENTGVGLQIWRLSDLKLLHTLRIPAATTHGSHAPDTASHHLFPGEPRLLRDGKTVMLATFTCGLYTVTGIDTDNPAVRSVYAFPGQDCAVPVVVGKYWLQTVPAIHSVLALDVSDPSSPREVSRVDLGPASKPHWLARDTSGERLVVNSGSASNPVLYLLRFDESTGKLSRDPSLPILDMSSVSVPGIGNLRAVPHATVFSR
ncbi:MAG TPA: hypothetical protein VM939_02145 [Gemmatimonadaceae bacterium]|nr:hypothetical protein [Gemmatimonadaceae bacterium]